MINVKETQGLMKVLVFKVKTVSDLPLAFPVPSAVAGMW